MILVSVWRGAHTHTNPMAQCLLSSGSDMYLHFSTENLHFICHMPRLTSVHVNIFSVLKFGDMHKRHGCEIHWDTSERGRHRANIPTSWQKLTQAQMYLTNSPLLCMFKCEPDGSEQWGLARCLIVCGGYRRGTLELIRLEALASCRKVPNPSVTHYDTVI